MTILKKTVLILAGILAIAMDELTKAYLEAERIVEKQEKSKKTTK
jgi:hypothetical protein